MTCSIEWPRAAPGAQGSEKLSKKNCPRKTVGGRLGAYG
jgi:hypothetical protein